MTPRERLRFLANALSRPMPPKVSFNLGVWQRPDERCGTAACAVGYATMLPELQAEGLSMFEDKSGWHEPRFGDMVGWKAVEEFFGLSPTQSGDLFSRHRYPRDKTIGPADVSNRIHALLLNEKRAETAP